MLFRRRGRGGEELFKRWLLRKNALFRVGKRVGFPLFSLLFLRSSANLAQFGPTEPGISSNLALIFCSHSFPAIVGQPRCGPRTGFHEVLSSPSIPELAAETSTAADVPAAPQLRELDRVP